MTKLQYLGAAKAFIQYAYAYGPIWWIRLLFVGWRLIRQNLIQHYPDSW